MSTVWVFLSPVMWTWFGSVLWCWTRTTCRLLIFFFFQAEDGIRDIGVTGVQTYALPIFRTALGHARECRPGTGSRSRSSRAGRQGGRAVHVRREAVHRPAKRDDGAIRSAVRVDGVRLHATVLPDPRGVPAPYGDVPLRRVPPAVVLAGGRELREDDADHEHRAVPVASRGLQPLQRSDVRRAQLQPDDDVRGFRAHQPQHHGSVE